MKEDDKDEKRSLTKNNKKVLGIQIKCPKHSWQRTVHIQNGIGCSKCYGSKLLNKVK